MVSARDIATLAGHLRSGVLAVAPARDVRLDRSAWPVRAYYRLWNELPVVRAGLFGRGVIGVAEAGFKRIADRPDLLGDDLFLNNQFHADERLVVAEVAAQIQAPRTVSDLVRRRVRAVQGNTEQSGGGGDRGTSVKDIVAQVRRNPALMPSAAVFGGVSVGSRLLARARRSRREWLRDESSRI